MFVLGISSGLKHGHHDGAAVLMKDGKVIAASEEERFTLAKHARGLLPKGAISFCLDYAGISIHDIDYVCSPLKTYENYSVRLEEYFKFHFNHAPKIELYDHHLCHAASSYYPSGFDESTVICFDFSGDSSSGVVIEGRGQEMKVIERFERHNSLGLYYGMMTQYLGYQMTNDEYKVMGLASYGEPRFAEEFQKILWPSGNTFEIDPDLDKRLADVHLYTTDFSTRQERIFTEKYESILGERRLPGQEITQRHKDIAASGQMQLEEIAKHVTRKAISKTGSKYLCLAGGVALNVKMNMELANLPEVSEIYVPSVPHDAGVALGAAILKVVEQGDRIEPINHAYFGPEYSSAHISKTLNSIGARYQEITDPVESAARDLANGYIVGWFQGRMEYGPRALGNRSILADPRGADIKNRINATIKYREEYRPFCPSVLSETQHEYFEDPFDSPFMTINFGVKPSARAKIPAVVHVDGTARIQTIFNDTNPKFHALVKEFSNRSGESVVVNTSLNINEQPTVKAPLEALHTFFCSGLDVLYLENFKLTK